MGVAYTPIRLLVLDRDFALSLLLENPKFAWKHFFLTGDPPYSNIELRINRGSFRDSNTCERENSDAEK